MKYLLACLLVASAGCADMAHSVMSDGHSVRVVQDEGLASFEIDGTKITLDSEGTMEVAAVGGVGHWNNLKFTSEPAARAQLDDALIIDDEARAIGSGTIRDGQTANWCLPSGPGDALLQASFGGGHVSIWMTLPGCA